MIYLDYNATAPLCPEVLAAMLPYLGEEFGNPSSVHRLGSRARVAVEAARAEVAALIGAPPREIVFTSGGTEANNLAVCGMARRRAGTILTTPIEHASVLQPVATLATSGRVVRHLPVDREGRVDLDALADALNQSHALVSIGWANNEIGTIQPIAAVADLCRAAAVPLHVDAVQALGKVAVTGADADLLALSAHKIGGPKGVGALVVRQGTDLEPLLRGGGQERGVRAGTEHVAGIVGFGVACRLAVRALPPLLPLGEGRGEGDVEALRERLWCGVAARVAGVQRNSPSAGCLPNTLNVRIPGVSGEALVAALDLEDIAVSTGSACAAGAAEPSHVLRAIGRTDDEARDGVRFSLGVATTAAEINRVVDVVASCVARMRSVPRREAAYA